MSKLPKTVWQQGFKNLLFTLLIMLPLIGVVVLIVVFGFRQSVENSFRIVFGIWVVIFFFFIFTWFKQRRQAGQVLLDLIPFPKRTLVFIAGGLFIISSLSGAYAFAWGNTTIAWLTSFVTGLSMASYALIIGVSRLQIREHGIWAYVELVKWNRIESFAWVDEGGKVCTLKLQYTGPLPTFLRTGAMPVPLEKKSQVEVLLTRYLPGKAVEEKRA